MNSEEKRALGGFIAVVLVIIAVLFCAFCVRVVGTSKVAVITTFGKVTGTASTGLRIKAPWQGYHKIDLSVQADSAEYATATKDSQAVSQEVTIRWQVDPDMAVELYEQYLGKHQQKLFDAVKGDAVKEGSAILSITEYIPKREELRTAMKYSLTQQLGPQGIKVIGVEISNIVLPEGFEKAIADRQVAEEKKKTADINQQTALIDAETNKILADSYSKPEFFKIEWLKLQKEWIAAQRQAVENDKVIPRILPDTLVIGEGADTVFPLR